MKQVNKKTSARLTIDLAAIRHNYHLLQKQLNASECAAVLKADAYGLGVEEVAYSLRDDVRTFFVAHLEEGKKLRRLSLKQRIFILHGGEESDFDEFVQNNLIPVLNTLSQVKAWRSFCEKRQKNHPAALQIDSGMSRFGLSEHELESEELSGFQPILVMSHLACADQPDHPANKRQYQVFSALSERFPGVPRSLSASSGIFLGEDYHFDIVRPGAALYGIAPNSALTDLLKPVIQLDARILQIRDIEAGDCVGYGFTWKADKSAKLATVGIGYADGFTRLLSGRACLWWKNYRLPIIGRVSMDSLSVDISDVPDGALLEGMWVSVIGSNQSVDDLANAAETIGYEILTSLGHRFSRLYHE